ncbi:MAG: hypothetical protein V4469_00575 [Patescibacteria group bacterium]
MDNFIEQNDRILFPEEVLKLPVGTKLITTRDMTYSQPYPGTREEVDERHLNPISFEFFEGDTVEITKVDVDGVGFKWVSGKHPEGERAFRTKGDFYMAGPSTLTCFKLAK